MLADVDAEQDDEVSPTVSQEEKPKESQRSESRSKKKVGFEEVIDQAQVDNEMDGRTDDHVAVPGGDAVEQGIEEASQTADEPDVVAVEETVPAVDDQEGDVTSEVEAEVREEIETSDDEIDSQVHILI